MFDLGPDIEDEMSGVGILADFAIDHAPDRQRMRVGNLIRRGDPWPEWGMGVEGLPQHPLRGAVLPGPLGRVVTTAVTEHRGRRIAPGDVPTASADDCDQLSFVI